MHERFGAEGKVLVCLEQSRGALIYQLMAYELFELYPINPSSSDNSAAPATWRTGRTGSD
jgi:hypothetical protein